EVSRSFGVMRVHVQRVMVHRDEAEQMIVALGHRLAGPVPIHGADFELFVVTTELHPYRPDESPGNHPATSGTNKNGYDPGWRPRDAMNGGALHGSRRPRSDVHHCGELTVG